MMKVRHSAFFFFLFFFSIYFNLEKSNDLKEHHKICIPTKKEVIFFVFFALNAIKVIAIFSVDVVTVAEIAGAVCRFDGADSALD